MVCCGFMDKNFVFSVLMPIYNVEKYLAEAIDSLINQSFGFEENIELIIVDDGSPDNSKDIALKYQEKYPNNIKVFSKSNAGQASAFNYGMKYLNGKYVSFLDSDDRISSNAFEEAYNFFEKYDDEVDVISIPMMYFENKTGSHALNYKFDSTRVIDLNKQPHNPQLSLASSFIKREALEGFEFNTVLPHAYDTLVLNKIILDKKKLGVMDSCTYFYRRRQSNTSMINTAPQKKEYYNYVLKNLYINLIDYSKEKYGHVPEYIQYLIAYNVQWFDKISDFPDFFSKEEINEFWQTFQEILSYIDDDIIKDSRIIKRGFIRDFLFYVKNKREFHIDTVDNQSEIYLKSGEYPINNLHDHRLYVENIRIKDDILRINGIFTSLCNYNVLKFKAIKTLPNGEEEIFNESDEFADDESFIKRILGIDWQFRHYFNFEIPVEEEELKVKLKIIYNENDIEIGMENDTKFRDSSIITDRINYFVEDSRLISFKENSFYVCPYSFEKVYELKQELLSYIQDILESEKNLKKENKSLNKKNRSLNKKNQSLNKKNDKLKVQLKESKDKNEEILNSTSWKVTKPIRMPKQFIKNMKE